MYIRIYGQHCVSLHLIFFWHEKQYIFTFIRILSFSFTQKCFLNIKYLVTSLKIEQHQQKKNLFVYLVPYWWTCRFLSNFNPCFKLWWNKHLHVFLRLCRWVFFSRKGIFEQIYSVPLKIWPTFQLCFGPIENHFFSDSSLVRSKA